MKKIRILWHQLRFCYYHQLANDCLDASLKTKLLHKANRQKGKLREVTYM